MGLRSLVFGQPDTFFPEESSQKVKCGPGIGEVVLNKDGSVVLSEKQLIIYTGYEVRKGLNPAEVKPLTNGTFLVSMRE